MSKCCSAGLIFHSPLACIHSNVLRVPNLVFICLCLPGVMLIHPVNLARANHKKSPSSQPPEVSITEDSSDQAIENKWTPESRRSDLNNERTANGCQL